MAGVPVGPPTEEQRRDRARGFFDATAWLFDAIGFDDAAAGIRHYRDGSGTDVRLDAERHPLIDAAQRSTRTQFESRTFTGQSNKSRGLLGLKPGEELEFEDDWDRDYSLSSNRKKWRERVAKVGADAWDLTTNPGTYLTLGRFGLKSNGRFRAKRDGDLLRITWDAQNNLGQEGDAFNFNSDQPGGHEARLLEAAGEARPFSQRYSRNEPVEAILNYEPDGSLKIGQINWGRLLQ